MMKNAIPAILCVDDEPVVLESLNMQLKREFGDQYFYEFAESVDEAMEVIEELHEEGIDIVVLVSNWLMPALQKDKCLIEIHKRFPKIISIRLDGEEGPLQEDASKTDLFYRLYQPWDGEELIENIKSRLAKT